MDLPMRRALIASAVVLAMFGTPATVASEGSSAEPVRAALAARPSGHGYRPGLSDLLQQQAKLLGHRWAGSSVEPDGSALVGLTSGGIPTALASRPDVRVVIRRFSSAHLNEAADTVAARLNPLLMPGVKPGAPVRWAFDGWVDVLENVFVLRLDNRSWDRRADVRRTLGSLGSSGAVRLVRGVVPRVATTCVPASCPFPIRGGLHLNYAGINDGCTSGFVMKRWDGVRTQSTAGHCLSSNFSHAGYQIGPTLWADDRGNVDGRIVEHNNQALNAPRNWVFRTANQSSAVTSKVTIPDTQFFAPICHIGRASGESCGFVVSTNAMAGGRTGWGATSARVCRRDSGAPVVGADNTWAFGIMSRAEIEVDAQCTFGTLGYFMWVRDFEAASGFEVLLTETTETLGPGQRMHAGDFLRSRNWLYTLNMQPDGNLVMYGPAGQVWQSGTIGNPGAFVTMQNAGNLVVYRGDGVPLWAQPTTYYAGSRLVMQDDRNLVIYAPNGVAVWASNTNI